MELHYNPLKMGSLTLDYNFFSIQIKGCMQSMQENINQ